MSIYPLEKKDDKNMVIIKVIVWVLSEMNLSGVIINYLKN